MMAKQKADNTKAAPMTYESTRSPNLRDRLAREARQSEDGTVDVEKVVKNAEKES